MRLKDRIVLITGAGSGIGKETSLLFADEGATVIVLDINNDNGLQTVSEILYKNGKAEYVKCDVTNSKEVESAISYVISKYKKRCFI